MRLRPRSAWPLLSLLGGLALSPSALAQQRSTDDPYKYPDDEDSDSSRRGRDDAPYAYPDDDGPVKSGPRRQAAQSPDETDRDFRRAAKGEEEEKGRFRNLAGIDDPNTGLAFEALGGVMLLSSARGQLFGDPALAFGGRFTWEYGRLLNSEPLREALWLDLRYTFVGQREGTQLVVGDVQRHYATLAPAYEFTFGEGSDYGFFLQAGGGVAYELARLEVGGKMQTTLGMKSLIQYGVGLRGRTRLSIESNLRLAWRLEVMRFRRGYQDDTFAGLSAGLGF